MRRYDRIEQSRGDKLTGKRKQKLRAAAGCGSSSRSRSRSRSAWWHKLGQVNPERTQAGAGTNPVTLLCRGSPRSSPGFNHQFSTHSLDLQDFHVTFCPFAGISYFNSFFFLYFYYLHQSASNFSTLKRFQGAAEQIFSGTTTPDAGCFISRDKGKKSSIK